MNSNEIDLSRKEWNVFFVSLSSMKLMFLDTIFFFFDSFLFLPYCSHFESMYILRLCFHFRSVSWYCGYRSMPCVTMSWTEMGGNVCSPFSFCKKNSQDLRQLRWYGVFWMFGSFINRHARLRTHTYFHFCFFLFVRHGYAQDELVGHK